MHSLRGRRAERWTLRRSEKSQMKRTERGKGRAEAGGAHCTFWFHFFASSKERVGVDEEEEEEQQGGV